MKIKSIYFTVILITICLFTFIGCNSAINDDLDFSNLYGEYHLVGCRVGDEWSLWEHGEFAKKFYFDSIIIFNGTNHVKEEVIFYDDPVEKSTWYSFEHEHEFDLSNGKFYSISLLEDNRIEEGVFNFNNDVLEFMFAPDSPCYSDDLYWIYRKE